MCLGLQALWYLMRVVTESLLAAYGLFRTHGRELGRVRKSSGCAVSPKRLS